MKQNAASYRRNLNFTDSFSAQMTLDQTLIKVSHTTGEACSFLEMANACSDYIHDYAQISALLRNLTKKHTPFKLTHTHQKAFELVKKQLTQSSVMSYFDTSKTYYGHGRC